ncbi:MAG: DUF503 domain-containing protein [Nitrospinota bacterium]|nr:MAG: DUF503 domain-containing protein [Nitrospinota bacterium]
MIVGVCRIELYLHDNHSIKGKRQVLRKIKDRIKHQFNVSIAEVDYNDKWQRASLGVAIVSNDHHHAYQALEKVVTQIDRMYVAEIVDYHIELL